MERLSISFESSYDETAGIECPFCSSNIRRDQIHISGGWGEPSESVPAHGVYWVNGFPEIWEGHR